MYSAITPDREYQNPAVLFVETPPADIQNARGVLWSRLGDLELTPTPRKPSVGPRTPWAVDRVRSSRPHSVTLRTQFAERNTIFRVTKLRPRLERPVVFSPNENGTTAPHQNGENTHIAGNSRGIPRTHTVIEWFWLVWA